MGKVYRWCRMAVGGHRSSVQRWCLMDKVDEKSSATRDGREIEPEEKMEKSNDWMTLWEAVWCLSVVGGDIGWLMREDGYLEVEVKWLTNNTKGTSRFVALFPVIFLFLYLPLNLHTMFLGGVTFFFMSWLGSFKLILYAFDQGPLSSNPPLPLSHFISIACLPIKFKRNQENSSHKITEKPHKSPKDYACRVVLLLITIKAYQYKTSFHPLLTTSIYVYYIFFFLELILDVAASLARTLIGAELDPQFDQPHHATSVQDFWGKRWNLMVSSILRPTVYLPSRAIFGFLVPVRWVTVPAVFTTFLVSGIMHEMIFYYLGRLTPTWEVTWFFVIQGVWVGTEIVLKKKLGGLYEPPSVVSRILTLLFVIVTSFWLFFPPFLRLNPFTRGCKEAMAFTGTFKHGHLISPDEYSCPYF